MQDLIKLRKLYDLKTVYRAISINERFESVAEHSRSAMILADYFLEIIHLEIDRLRVYELLLYHDLAELETGDIPVDKPELRVDKKEKEAIAMKKIASEMPKVLSERYIKLFTEFEEKKTLEAKFANAIDKLDGDLHCIDVSKKDFIGWTEELARHRKQKSYQDFPEINEAFEKIITIYKEKGYI